MPYCKIFLSSLLLESLWTFPHNISNVKEPCIGEKHINIFYSLQFHVSDSPYQHEVTPLEIGMYILLGVFCLAIAVFMASCFVYASKHSDGGRRLPLERKSQSVHAAHDWVWLGRQTDGDTWSSGSSSLIQ